MSTIQHDKPEAAFLLIPASAIDANPQRNFRSEDSYIITVPALARDIKERGMLEPVEVEFLGPEHAPPYLLTWGFRRHAACTRLDPHYPMKCMVRPHDPERTDFDRIADMLAENVQRESLTAYEQSEALWRMKKAIPTAKHADIAQRANLSKQHVGNLIRIREKGSPDLVSRWRDYPHEFPDMVRLLEVLGLPPEKQLEAVIATRGRRAGAGNGKPDGDAERAHHARAAVIGKYHVSMLRGLWSWSEKASSGARFSLSWQGPKSGGAIQCPEKPSEDFRAGVKFTLDTLRRVGEAEVKVGTHRNKAAKARPAKRARPAPKRGARGKGREARA